MKLGRLLLVSAAPCVALAFTVGCGSGGGYRGASTTGGSSGASNTPAGAGGAGAGGVGGAAGSAQGSDGGALDAGSGGAAISAGQAGSVAAGMGGMGGLAGGAGTGGIAGDVTSGNAGAIGTGGLGATGGGSGAGAVSGASGAGAASGAGGAGATSGTSGASGIGGIGGSSGAAGNGGSAGTGGPLRTCGERCNTNADCRIFGADQGYQCNTTTHRCERFAEPCRSSIECIPAASFWIFACRNDADCFFFSDDLCVDVGGGVGRCARLAPSANGCTDPNPDEVMLPRFNVSGSALVCADTSRTCSDGECVAGCRTNTDCSPQLNGSVCDTQTRLCRCMRDADCGGPGVSRCNTATGACECTDSRDCEEVANANACLQGRCGCSGLSACNGDRTFSGTTFVCE